MKGGSVMDEYDPERIARLVRKPEVKLSPLPILSLPSADQSSRHDVHDGPVKATIFADYFGPIE